jgi:hypothetical protein
MRYLNYANHVTSNGIPEVLLALVDCSGSMDENDWKPSRKAAALKANKELIKVKAQHHPQDSIGIIGFGSYAELLHEPLPLTVGTQSLFRALLNPPCMGGTNFIKALKLAQTCLLIESVQNPSCKGCIGLAGFFSELFYGPVQQTPHHIKDSPITTETVRRIVMLSDGGHNEGGSPLMVASRLKDAGVVIDCIGIGGSSHDVDEELLKKIASSNPDGSVRYCFIGDKQTLIEKYETLALHIRPT